MVKDYVVFFTSRAKKFIESIDKKANNLVLDKIKEISLNPKREIYRSIDVKEKIFVARKGVYRINFVLEEFEKRIIIIKIGHRRNFYKK